MLSTRNVVRLALFASVATGCALGQSPEERTPRELEGVGVTEKLGSPVDLDLTFIAENGYPVALREYFKKGKPVVLNLVYYTCPMLCNLVLNGQTAAVRENRLDTGEKFEIVTISIDPTENLTLAPDKKALLSDELRPSRPGWHFLTDNGGNVDEVGRQVGFQYKLDEKTGQYAHPAVIFVLTPEGKIARYLYGIHFKPFDMRLALTEAAKEKFGVSPSNGFLLYCFHYDPAAKAYVPFAQNIMRLRRRVDCCCDRAHSGSAVRRSASLRYRSQGLVTTK